MAFSIVFGVLWLLFVSASVYSLTRGFSAPSLMAAFGGFIGLSKAFVDSLSKEDLRVYFFMQRLRIRLHSGAITRWWFAARFDGEYSQATIARLIRFMSDRTCFKFPVQIDFQNEREAQVQIDDTLIVRLSYAPAEDVPDATDATAHVTVLSKTIEVSYGYTKTKLATQIIPVLGALKSFLAPENSSYELNVDFTGANPFFAVYVNHLKPQQIGEFKVVLHLDTYSATPRAEKVEISSRSLHLTASSTDSFNKLALDFILLSPDVKMLAPAGYRA